MRDVAAPAGRGTESVAWAGSPILVVECKIETRDALQRLLGMGGNTTVIAGQGVAALVLDMWMPEMGACLHAQSG
jgi:hypothetical protein